MITGDKVKLGEYQAIPDFVGQVGVVRNWREVGLRPENMSHEYLVMFGDNGPYFWIHERYLIPQ